MWEKNFPLTYSTRLGPAADVIYLLSLINIYNVRMDVCVCVCVCVCVTGMSETFEACDDRAEGHNDRDER